MPYAGHLFSNWVPNNPGAFHQLMPCCKDLRVNYLLWGNEHKRWRLVWSALPSHLKTVWCPVELYGTLLTHLKLLCPAATSQICISHFLCYSAKDNTSFTYMVKKAASKFEDMLCGSDEFMEGFILSGEAMSVNNSTNYIGDGMDERVIRIQRFLCNHNNKHHPECLVFCFIGYLKNFQASTAFHN